ncbi:MAG: isocitrate lyase/phosphoenolpyruvate mutase family protein [Lentisphaerae bacterium]|nr:isocitrate lyase/phosphoenolpyruvate mutase family protein [Lentisphaerota bacterium]MCP4103262.1 isocitrate lyase/phosphoenolpyruvate mutase family protein [Lentisphaerota bacterium]
MDKEIQKQLAIDFADMHKGDEILILPNAWNGGSAKIFEKQGFKAIATTSAGVAYSLGYSDGEVVTMEELIRVTEQISSRVSVPLSVDMELGYADDVEDVCANVQAIIEAGAVGINIEDGHPGEHSYLEALGTHLDKIHAIAKLKNKLDIPFVINARTCVCWLKTVHWDHRFETAIERSNAFVDAGADCVFVPGALTEKEVRQLVEGIDAPVNIVVNPVFNDFDAMQEIGVKRLSIGSGAVRATYAKLIEMTAELYKDKSVRPMLNHNFSYEKANKFFAS